MYELSHCTLLYFRQQILGCSICLVFGLFFWRALQEAELLGQRVGDPLLPQGPRTQKWADALFHFLSPFMGHTFFGWSLDALPALVQLPEPPQWHGG